MKRIITGLDSQGRSCVESVADLDSELPHVVWTYEPCQILDRIRAIEPGVAAEWIGPEAPGGFVCYFSPMVPTPEPIEYPADFDEKGFHVTRTVDFNIVLKGELTLVLDVESVVLKQGDVVVQYATRHAWHNQSDNVAVLMSLMHRPQGD